MTELVNALKLLDRHDLLDSNEALAIMKILLLAGEVKYGKLTPTLKTWIERHQALHAASAVLRAHYRKDFKYE